MLTKAEIFAIVLVIVALTFIVYQIGQSQNWVF